jgi:hypothetical protein
VPSCRPWHGPPMSTRRTPSWSALRSSRNSLTHGRTPFQPIIAGAPNIGLARWDPRPTR